MKSSSMYGLWLLVSIDGLMILAILQKVLREAHVWSKLDHENVLPLLGITTAFDHTVSMVSLWMEAGNAFDYVQNKDIDPRPLVCFDVWLGIYVV